MRAYILCMSVDVAKLLGRRLRAIRQQIGGTQEAFGELSGISQAQLSHLESGHGFKQLQRLSEAIERAGGDPLDLFRDDTPLPPEVVELRELALQADPESLSVALAVLRKLVATTAQPAAIAE